MSIQLRVVQVIDLFDFKIAGAHLVFICEVRSDGVLLSKDVLVGVDIGRHHVDVSPVGRLVS